MPDKPTTPLGRFVNAMTGGETAIQMDGYDDCVLGLAFRCATDPVLVYDRDAVLAKLMGEGSEMTHDEAEEWIEFNMADAWVGEQTPFLLRRFQPEVWQEVRQDDPDGDDPSA